LTSTVKFTTEDIRASHYGHTNLSEDERFLVVDRIESVVWHSAGPEFLADCVRRQSIHVHLDVRADLLVREELAGDDLATTDEEICTVSLPDQQREITAKYD